MVLRQCDVSVRQVGGGAKVAVISVVSVVCVAASVVGLLIYRRHTARLRGQEETYHAIT